MPILYLKFFHTKRTTFSTILFRTASPSRINLSSPAVQQSATYAVQRKLLRSTVHVQHPTRRPLTAVHRHFTPVRAGSSAGRVHLSTARAPSSPVPCGCLPQTRRPQSPAHLTLLTASPGFLWSIGSSVIWLDLRWTCVNCNLIKKREHVDLSPRKKSIDRGSTHLFQKVTTVLFSFHRDEACRKAWWK
jgi:hypothetical protein